jgi:sulfotransferase family protein
MVRGILRQLAKESGLEPTGPEGAFFAAGVPKRELPRAIFKPASYFYHFSGVPFADGLPIAARSLIHVRDIRDILVSKYYSLRESHPEPGDAVSLERKNSFAKRRHELQSLDVDEGVLSLAAHGLSKATTRLREAVGTPGALLTRYEDMVYRKEDWAREVCDHFGWNCSEKAIQRAVAPFDVFPEEERQDRHVRQVHPGNYKRRLKPETVEKLNEVFREELEFFDYPIG